jgi:F-type H+-transporting ATPase subunit b
MQLLFITLSLLFSSTAFAGGGSYTAQIVNFILLLTLLFVVARKPILNALKGRADGIKADLDKSQKQLASAQANFDKVNQDIQNLSTKIEEMDQNAAHEIQSMKEELAERAQKDADRISQTAKKTIEEELEIAKTTLQRQAVLAAVELAEEQLKNNITAADHGRLSEDFVAAVDQRGNHGQ